MHCVIGVSCFTGEYFLERGSFVPTVELDEDIV